MDQTTVSGWLAILLGPFGLTVALIVFVFGLWKEWWVMGGAYKRSLDREARYEQLVLATLETQKTTVAQVAGAVARVAG